MCCFRQNGGWVSQSADCDNSQYLGDMWPVVSEYTCHRLQSMSRWVESRCRLSLCNNHSSRHVPQGPSSILVCHRPDDCLECGMSTSSHRHQCQECLTLTRTMQIGAGAARFRVLPLMVFTKFLVRVLWEKPLNKWTPTCRVNEWKTEWVNNIQWTNV